MRRLQILALAVATTLLMGGSMPTSLQHSNIQHELDELTRRGFTYRMLDEDLIELTDPVSGEKHPRDLARAKRK